jgi:aldehyde dehydrogenase (NAD+)/betaine-aldehyde dehydrogenase
MTPTALPRTSWNHFIDGKWVPSDGGEVIGIQNPSTGSWIAEVARGTSADIDLAVAAARRAFESRVLLDMRPSERGALMLDVARHFRDLAEETALVDCLESGKPIQTARNEPGAAIRYFTYYGGMADKFEGVSIPLGRDYIDYTIRTPFGVSAQIVPWNFPLQIAARCVACAIATANTVVLKTPELSPLSCTYIAEACSRAGVPDGVVNIVCGYGDEAGEALVNHGDIDHIVFTGSVATGQRILRAATNRVIPCIMELGGKSAAIVHADADVDQVVASMSAGIFTHAGQICSAASRLVVHRSIREEAVDRIASRAASLRLGPAIEGPDLGPVISEPQRDRILGFVERAVGARATVVTGGSRAGHLDGFFVQPTVIDDVAPDAEIVQQEIFGPVLVVQTFDDPEEAVALANGTDFGLCAGVHTNDLRLAHWTADRLIAGQVFVNEWFAGGVETPFGGTKRSGFGREKGQEALLNYVQTKNVAIRLGQGATGRPGG